MLGAMARDGKRVPRDPQATYLWFHVAAIQAGSEAANYLRKDLADSKAALSPEQLSVAETSVYDWIQAHPHHDVFEFKDGLRASYFPMEEVYETDQGVMGTRKEPTAN